MRTSQHNTDATARRRSVKSTVAVVTAAGLLSGVAVAALTAKASLEGTVNRGEYMATWDNMSGAAELQFPGGAGYFKVADSNRTLVMPVTSRVLYEGESAFSRNLGIRYTAAGKPGWVGRLEGTPQPGWEVSVNKCGTALTAGTTEPIVLTIKAIPSATPANPLDLNGFGVVITDTNPNSTDPAPCTVTGS